MKLNVFLTDLGALRAGQHGDGRVLPASPTRRAPRSASPRCRAARGRDRLRPGALREATGSAAAGATAAPPRSPSGRSPPARRRPGAGGDAREARSANRAGPAVPPAAALRGPHARRADRHAAPRRARGHRRRGAARRGGVPPAARAAGAPADGSGFSRCASSISPARSRTAGARHAPALLRRGTSRAGGLEIVHPEYRRVERRDAAPRSESLTPIYPTTEGVQQGRLRTLTEQALALLAGRRLRDCLPPDVLARAAPADARRGAALRASPAAGRGSRVAERRPAPGAAPTRLRRTARAPDQPAADARRRRDRDSVMAAAAQAPTLVERCLADLPFRLTGAQHARVARDRRGPRASPPDAAPGAGRRRLRQDGGRGARGAAGGRGTARRPRVMAPTELLAEQHARNFAALARAARRSGRAADRPAHGHGARAALEQDLARGDIQVAGRHARAVPGRRAFRRLGARHRRRAAPLRRAPAPAAAGEGRSRTAATRTSSS